MEVRSCSPSHVLPLARALQHGLCPSLESFSLSTDHADGSDLGALVGTLGTCHTLRHLSLRCDTEASRSGIRALVRSLRQGRFAELETLRLEIPVEEEHMKKLGKALERGGLRGLRELTLGEDQAKAKSLPIARALLSGGCPQLARVQMAGSAMDAETVGAWAGIMAGHAPCSSGLRVLRYSDWAISAREGAALAGALRGEGAVQLEELSLKVSVWETGPAPLIEALRGPAGARLRRLDVFTPCEKGARGAEALLCVLEAGGLPQLRDVGELPGKLGGQVRERLMEQLRLRRHGWSTDHGSEHSALQSYCALL
jgi:hypothetical protein